MNQYFAYNGGRVADPEAPAVVLIHGAGMDHTVWHYLARAMAHKGWRVLALDLPGHGRSTGFNCESVDAMADWVRGFLESGGIERFCLVGHSLGGLISLRIAATCDRVDRMVLIATAAGIPVNADLQGAANAGDPRAVELIVSWSYGAGTWRGGRADPGTSALVLARRILGRGLGTSLAIDLEATGSYGSGVQDAGRVQCPTLVLAGEADRMVSVKAASQLAELVPAGRLHIVPGGGHMLMIQRPDDIRNAIMDFVAAV